MVEPISPLSTMILIPLIGAAIVAFIKDERMVKIIAIPISTLPLIISVFLLISLDFSNPGYQFGESHSWVPSLGISYTVGVDGLSLPMVFLTSLLTTLAMLFSMDVEDRANQFFSLLLILEVGLLGVFVALDFFLFYIFWEIVLIPMFFLINIWGGPNKRYAAIKFLIYTHIASLVMLLAIMAMYFQTYALIKSYTFSMITITGVGSLFPQMFQIIVFGSLLFGFGVKMPIVPFHTWLPDAHVEAPTAGSVLLAGVLLKMGGYGLVRVGLTILPEGRQFFVPVMAIIGTIGILYAAMLCLTQVDLKKMIALSSVSHMGLVLLGISTLTTIGIVGAMFQMFAHGLITAVLFMMAGALHHHTGTRDIPKLRGLSSKMPFAMVILVAGFFASLGLPGMVSFISEVMVFMGTFNAFSFWVFIPLLGVVLTAAYYLWTLQKIAFGPFREVGSRSKLHDLYIYEAIPLAILIALIGIFGVWPSPITDVISSAIPPVLGGGI